MKASAKLWAGFSHPDKEKVIKLEEQGRQQTRSQLGAIIRNFLRAICSDALNTARFATGVQNRVTAYFE